MFAKLRRILSAVSIIALLFVGVPLPAFAEVVINEPTIVLDGRELSDGEVSFLNPDDIEIRPELLTIDEKKQVLNSLFEAGISDVTRAIRSGLVSCEEVTAYYLERIDAYNSTYNCFITLMEDQALARARELDERLAAGDSQGLMFGVPIVVKDNIDVAGVPTTNGYSWQNAYTPTENASIVDAVLNEGAVILGKANMAAGAQSATHSYSNTAGMTKNAYNKATASGGSSGGSAVAVSLNFCVVGLGTDTNSSLRIPAAMNGCVAMRFTSGMLDREGIVILNKRRDVPGAITRTVEDNALMADIFTGFQYAYSDNLDADALNGARIGVLKELANRNYSDSENKASFQNALDELEACGAVLVDVSFPNLFSYSNRIEDGESELINVFLSEYLDILEQNNLAALVYPAYLSKPYSASTTEITWAWLNNARPLASSIGIPEISVPTGVHSKGAGLGIEFSSGPHNEKLLYNLAYSYTSHFNHREIPAGASNLYEGAGDYTPDEIEATVRGRLEDEALEAAALKVRATFGDTLGQIKQSINASDRSIKFAITDGYITSLIEKIEAENHKNGVIRIIVIILSVLIILFALAVLAIRIINRELRRKRRRAAMQRRRQAERRKVRIDDIG